ncbi:MAG: hypothetical protein II823_04305 [Kiritimatiellae bacterium]|nr:hypothetical protein [Kiritimatiellia bacterium]
MVKISLDNQDCIEQHREAYQVLGRVLEDLASGKAIYTIGRGGKSKVLSRASNRNTVARKYYTKLTDLCDNYPCLSPEHIHDVVSKVKKYEVSLNKKMVKRAKRILATIYSYEKFSKGMSPQYKYGVLSWVANPSGWGAWEFLRRLNVRSCVYCNAETIFSLLLTNELPGGGITPKYDSKTHKRSALDHFYNHSKYPFLGLTLSNLVPACTRCNTNVKGARELNHTKHIYPYAESFNDGVKFAIAYKPGKRIVDLEESDLHIAFVPRMESKIYQKSLESVAFFHLSKVYNQLHKIDALTVLKRIEAFPQSYREFLAEKYPGIKGMVLDYVCRGSSLNPSHILSHNLSKLTIDIEKQFGVADKAC